MKRQFLTALLITTSFIVASSQPDSLINKKKIYSFVPQYLINRGIRVDFERKISDKSYIQVCPQFYLSEKEGKDFVQSSNQFDYLIGGGFSIYHKIFTVEDFKYNGLYLAYGPSYNFFHLEYIDNSDGNGYSATASIHKVGADLILGYQILVKDVVVLDVYTGLGTRLSFMETDGKDKERFSTSYFGYNYTGNIMHLGFRIGIIL
jgi:hypothetical protein